MLLALVLAVGLRPGGKAAAPGSDAFRVGGIVAPTDLNPSSVPGAEKDLGKDPAQVSVATWGLSGEDSEANSSHAPREAQAAMSATPTLSPRRAVSRKRGDDLIARDTTIYFDKRFEPPPKAKRTKAIARSRGNLGEHH